MSEITKYLIAAMEGKIATTPDMVIEAAIKEVDRLQAENNQLNERIGGLEEALTRISNGYYSDGAEMESSVYDRAFDIATTALEDK